MSNLKDMDWLMERIGTTERHVRSLVFARLIPYVKIGKLLRFDPERIDEWIASNTVETRVR